MAISTSPGMLASLVGRLSGGVVPTGVSRAFFFQSILPELRVVRCGRLRLVPVRSLEEWLDRQAARAFE
jgi:hypothetical protein